MSRKTRPAPVDLTVPGATITLPAGYKVSKRGRRQRKRWCHGYTPGRGVCEIEWIRVIEAGATCPA